MLLKIISTFGALMTFTAHASLPASHVLAQQQYSLADRYPNEFVNRVMADNILLTLSYMRGAGKTSNPDWKEVEKPFIYSLLLKPGEQFAFHDDVLPKYQNNSIKTTNSHFNAQEGFLSDGYLFGDGVCHLASFINYVARHAGLLVDSPTAHEFARIPEISREYGVAIYSSQGKNTGSELQNLYITNNKLKPVNLVFAYKNNALSISVIEK